MFSGLCFCHSLFRKSLFHVRLCTCCAFHLVMALTSFFDHLGLFQGNSTLSVPMSDLKGRLCPFSASLVAGYTVQVSTTHTHMGNLNLKLVMQDGRNLPNGMAKMPLPSRGFQGSILRRKVNVRILLKSQNLQGAMHLGLTPPCTPKHFAELI